MSNVNAGWRRRICVAAGLALATLVATAGVGTVGGATASAGTASTGTASTGTCAPRLLVLSAMPLELDPLLAAASIDPRRTVVLDGRSFYEGTLRGNDVIMSLTGIGLVNARR